MEDEDGDGTWEVVVQLEESGDWPYQFRVDGSSVTPKGADRYVPSGYDDNTMNGILEVEECLNWARLSELHGSK
jgi:hypothetical protein